MNKRFLKELSAALIITSIQLCSISGFASAVPPSANISPRSKGADASNSPCSVKRNSKQDFGDKLATLGRQSQNNPLLPVKKSVFKGVPIDYVSSATGEMSFAVNDISFDGNAPLLFQRVYSSSNNEDIGLGKGWSYAFNDKIVIDFNKAVLTDSAGETYHYTGKGVRFTEESRTQEFVLTTDEPASVQSFRQIDENTIKEKNELTSKTYEKFGDAFYLTRIKLPDNREIVLERLPDGRASKISNGVDGIKLKWSKNQNPRLLSISDSTGRNVKFQQNAKELQSVKSVLDGQWTYDYQDGKLSKITDPTNRILLQVAYDTGGRAVESGDAVRRVGIKYESGGQPSAIRTTVTDSLDYALLVEHNSNGSVKRTVDEKGFFADFKYDSLNRLTAVTDENGQAASFVYDSNDRLARKFVRNQGEESFQYDKKGNLSSIDYGNRRVEITYDVNNLPIERNIKRGEISVKIKLDGNGNPVKIESSDGKQTNFEYDDKGREIAVTYSDAGRFETAYNPVGKKSSEKMPSGSTHNFKYNADNKITEKSDAKGNAVQAEYDRSGAIKKVGNNKIWVKNTRDSVGRIVKVESSTGKSRNFRYDARGALVEYVNAKGEKFEFSYDERGKLQMATSPKGVIFGQRQTGKPNEVAFVKSNFSFKPLAAVQSGFDSCDTLGNDDFFTDNTYLTYSIDLSSSLMCDPFGGSGEFSSFGGMGSTAPNGENCEQCLAREWRNCEATYDANILLTLGGALVAGAACTAITLVAGIVACGVLVVASQVAIGEAHRRTMYNCFDNVASKCESKC